MRTRLSRAALVGLGASLAALPLAGCGLLDTASEAPGKLVGAFSSETPVPKVDPVTLATRLMRFADLFAYEIKHACEEFAEAADTNEARIQALDWQIVYSTAAYKRATVEQPYGGLFDLILVITALRAVHEERWSLQWGEPHQVMIAALKRLEDAVWKLAEEGMTPEQLADARVIVKDWVNSDPDARMAEAARLPGSREVLESRSGSVGLVSGLSGLVRIDPLSGLEPVEREVAQTRAWAERFFFFVQRLPELAEARVHLVGLRAAESGETQRLLAGWEQATRSFESLAATAAALPADIATEREAALAQISAELERQRAGLVSDLERASEPLEKVLGETRTAAEAIRALSDSLQQTVQTTGTFLDRFEPDEAEAAAAAAAAAAPPEPEQPPGRPFDITEYGAAAERIGVAVHELNSTLATLDQTLPRLERVLDEAAARGKSTVDHAFRRVLELLAVALVGGAAMVILVRRFSRPRTRPPAA